MSSFTFDVFISYSHHDADWVRSWLLPRLESAGLRVCIDFRNFDVGASSIANMEKAVKNSRKTILVMTPNWTQSEWTDFESLLTQTRDPSGRKRRLVPILLKACDLPDRLAILTYADLTDPAQWEAQLTRVIDAIRESPIPQASTHPVSQFAPNLVHPYALQANFTGRKQERDELTAWLADDAYPIYALVAIGGMGKSALAWYWMKNDVLSLAQSAASAVEGVMWWSFYEGESSFAKFIDEALKYVSGEPTIDIERFPMTYDRAQELRKQLQNKRVLFVLDGFERQLRAYARLDAAYKQDDATNISREERACVDPIAARWLSDIAAGTTLAKVLLTTRLMIRDLEDRAGDALAGVFKRELKELPRDDAIEFMHLQGVTKGTPAEIVSACAAYGYHPLSLRLLSGLIARDARTPGDIAAAPRHDVHADLVQRQHHVLEQSYNALPKRERALLSRIAAFRSPVTYEALLIFNTLGGEPRFEAALDDLQTRGLLQRDIAHNCYDLHPIVRHYAYDRLADKTGIHTRLRDYFAEIPVIDKNKVQSIEDLAPVIELYHHTVCAGGYEEAIRLYYDRLWQTLYYRFGAYQTEIELLLAVFPIGEDRPLLLKEESTQAWTLNELANSYSLSGQPRLAVQLLEKYTAIHENTGDKKNSIRGLNNISSSQLMLGELAAAERNLRRFIELSLEIKEEFDETVGHLELGLLFTYCGAFDKAGLELKISAGYYTQINYKQGTCLNESYRSLRFLLMGDMHLAIQAARAARKLADVERNERDIIRAEWLLGTALVMEGKDLNVATEHLTDALIRCRRINMVDHEPNILLAWARWHRARGNAQEAQAYAEEALAIADRCEFRLKQAEIHNFLARLALDAGKRAAARQYAETARERAWCDGPPYCYKPALDEAERMLRELGAEEEK